jgi:hypothetical protein
VIGYRPDNRCSIPDTKAETFLFATASRLLNSASSGHGGSFGKDKAAGCVTLTIHRMPRLRMSGGLSPFLNTQLLMVRYISTRTALAFHFSQRYNQHFTCSRSGAIRRDLRHCLLQALSCLFTAHGRRIRFTGIQMMLMNTSLSFILIYWRHKCIAGKLITLHISQCLELEIVLFTSSKCTFFNRD